jgi:hypothetical protein
MRRAGSLFLPLLLVLAGPTALLAQKKPLTADELWAIPRVGNPVLSPDARMAAYTVTTYDMEADHANADI